MGGGRINPVPRAIDVEAHHYPRHWKRQFLFLYGGLYLINWQINRYIASQRQYTMGVGEYMDWGSKDAPKRVRY